jgi:glycosyltransferase involved in cell wall biosynthesis
MTLRVTLVADVPAPFVVEVADAVHALSTHVQYEVLFSQPEASSRGSHWRVDVGDRPYIHVRPRSEIGVRWMEATLRRSNPHIVICGGYRGEAFRAARSYAHRTGAQLGFWGEPPLPHLWPLSWVRRRVFAQAIRGTGFALCVGDRAYAEYSRFVPVGKACIIPYGQDLSHHFAIERRVSADPIRFLFSGRLVRQHNLRHLFWALAVLARERPGAFSVTIAARGPEQARLNRVLESSPALASVLTYDRDYERWEDRIRPFARCDALLYPSLHAGWGLVVPEAMAAGMLVISSAGVGSARMLVTPGVNGLMIGTGRRDVAAALRWCLNNPLAVRQMGLEARNAVHRVTASAIAETFVSVMSRTTNLRPPA